jgi:hypothetical protein
MQREAATGRPAILVAQCFLQVIVEIDAPADGR